MIRAPEGRKKFVWSRGRSIMQAGGLRSIMQAWSPALHTLHSLLSTHHSPLVTHHSLLITRYSSLITHHSSRITQKNGLSDSGESPSPIDLRHCYFSLLKPRLPCTRRQWLTC